MENPNLDFSSLEPAFQALKWARANMPAGIEKSGNPLLKACSSLADGFETLSNFMEKSCSEFSEQLGRCVKAEAENGVMKQTLLEYRSRQDAIEKRLEVVETPPGSLPIVKVAHFEKGFMGSRLASVEKNLDVLEKQPAVLPFSRLQVAEKMLQGQAGFAGDDPEEAALADLNKQYANQGDAILKRELGQQIATLEIKLARRKAAAGF